MNSFLQFTFYSHYRFLLVYWPFPANTMRDHCFVKLFGCPLYDLYDGFQDQTEYGWSITILLTALFFRCLSYVSHFNLDLFILFSRVLQPVNSSIIRWLIEYVVQVWSETFNFISSRHTLSLELWPIFFKYLVHFKLALRIRIHHLIKEAWASKKEQLWWG